MKRVLIAMASVAAVLMLLAGSCNGAFPPATWKKGDEVQIFNHSFDEEYWTAPDVDYNDSHGTTAEFSASYVNSNHVQAFLFALNKVTNENGTVVAPFQLFGMHYFTPQNREVFIGSVFAFMMAFNDTYNGTGPGQNNLPDPGNEKVYYIIPFGAEKAVGGTYTPETTVIPVTKLGNGHYKFGIQYKNLYAFVVENWLASLIWSTGMIAKFSELTVTYEVLIDEETGEVKAESWYTIGQVSELWMIIFGVPIKVADPHVLGPTMDLAVVHFATVFTSKYQGAYGNTSGKSFDTGITENLEEDISIKIGNDGERAMKIGTRGTFDVINEDTGTKLKTAQPAYNAIVSANALDLTLLWTQLGFAGGLMSIFAYAMSKDVQGIYTGPKDLCDHGLNPWNPKGFFAKPLWYGVTFPGWNDYRIEHDPVYTAYANMNPQTTTENAKISPGATVAILVVVAVAVVAVVVIIARRR
jgi:hypothetical protein